MSRQTVNHTEVLTELNKHAAGRNRTRDYLAAVLVASLERRGSRPLGWMVCGVDGIRGASRRAPVRDRQVSREACRYWIAAGIIANLGSVTEMKFEGRVHAAWC